MICGEIRRKKSNPDHLESFKVLSNRGGNTELFGSDDKDTVGVSNSKISEPWPKVNRGITYLKYVILKAQEKDWTQEKLLDELFEVLTSDTYPLNGVDDRDLEAIFENLRYSVFVPVIDTDINSKQSVQVHSTPVNNQASRPGRFYGTRTQTIILVDKKGHVTYVEKTLHEADEIRRIGEPLVKQHQFDIEGWV